MTDATVTENVSSPDRAWPLLEVPPESVRKMVREDAPFAFGASVKASVPFESTLGGTAKREATPEIRSREKDSVW